MPEATIVCLDDSEYMRNGDFSPTRLAAQKDACNMLCGSKIREHPENSVGLMTMAQRRVLVTLASDQGPLLAAAHNVQPKGQIDFMSAVQVAQLVLKHRQAKQHRQRIVVFIGSPIDADEAQMIKLGKKLKKSNISIDVVSFGEEDANTKKLEAFIDAVNKEDSSHLLVVPAGAGNLSDSLASSAIIGGSGAGAGIGGGGNDFAEYGGIDPSADPELAMALRISLEEERQRQQQQQQQPGSEDQAMDTGADAPTPAAPSAVSSSQAPAGMEDDPELAAALAMSMQDQSGTSSSQPAAAPPAEPDFASMTEEEQLEYALRMSMPAESAPAAMDSSADAGGEPAAPATEESAATPADQAQVAQDPEFYANLVSGLPGVDINDPAIQEALRSLQSASGGNGEEKKDDKKDTSK